VRVRDFGSPATKTPPRRCAGQKWRNSGYGACHVGTGSLKSDKVKKRPRHEAGNVRDWWTCDPCKTPVSRLHTGNSATSCDQVGGGGSVCFHEIKIDPTTRVKRLSRDSRYLLPSLFRWQGGHYEGNQDKLGFRHSVAYAVLLGQHVGARAPWQYFHAADPRCMLPAKPIAINSLASDYGFSSEVVREVFDGVIFPRDTEHMIIESWYAWRFFGVDKKTLLIHRN
jgi:hypothetical protein